MRHRHTDIRRKIRRINTTGNYVKIDTDIIILIILIILSSYLYGLYGVFGYNVPYNALYRIFPT